MNGKNDLRMEEMRPADWAEVCAIYGEGITTGLATFETSLPEWPEWNRNHLEAPRLVTWRGGVVPGWAALSPVSERCVYGGVAEVSVYVAAAQRSQGLGKMLLQELVSRSEAEGIWTLQAGIFPENEASIRVHLACGFRQVGIREQLGRLNGAWRDVALLERRSSIV